MRLKELRRANNLTQSQLAEKIGCNQTAIGKYERGDLQPSIEMLCKLSDIFGCSIDYLLGRENEMGQIITDSDLSEDEKTLISRFRQLTNLRQKTILESMSDMIDSQKFRGLDSKSIS